MTNILNCEYRSGRYPCFGQKWVLATLRKTLRAAKNEYWWPFSLTFWPLFFQNGYWKPLPGPIWVLWPFETIPLDIIMRVKLEIDVETLEIMLIQEAKESFASLDLSKMTKFMLRIMYWNYLTVFYVKWHNTCWHLSNEKPENCQLSHRFKEK